MEPVTSLESGDALLVVDVQRDFCPGGALAVEEGHQVVPVLNTWIRAAVEKGVAVFLSRDWHPKEHLSFKDRGGQWPPHCVQDTEGAEFHPGLEVPDTAVIVTKGVRFDQDQYSVFDQTGLLEELKRRGVRRVWVGGLAQDVCVLASALDARKAGLGVRLIRKATRPVTPEGGDKAIAQMQAEGVSIFED